MIEAIKRHKAYIIALLVWLFIGLPALILWLTIRYGLPMDAARIVTTYVAGIAIGAPGMAVFAAMRGGAPARPASTRSLPPEGKDLDNV